ncbi:DUF445 domain-containing protein [Thiomicrorhabdus sp. ZW0627]|uniref:DUF445 domain-containing protein n=1 Tax=Thiomicrorhabdus sp. ZW0627 TaxID=3039774 RepID=UPI002436F19F|nr:DUF445 domain-containing protein [Thiomicrorhabdus sp. ZW0627]MDG6773181.1 DUF445 domain-containing protein [Thiomicrorhabdus sp. ZW0627]
MNKSLITNLLAALLLMVGIVFSNSLLFWTGLFALSGALTNWLAIYMLFEKVPGLYGSGVIPNRFEAFKAAIRELMMQQFFNQENIDRFVSGQPPLHTRLQLSPVIEKVDLTPAFDKLVQVIMNSSFGSMLGMFGGADALNPLKEPFISNMKSALIEMTEEEKFLQLLQEEIDQPDVMADIQAKIEEIIDARLAELTPQLVKQMVQEMIKQHLGWLVVWGGVFGGLIGLISALVSTYLAV